MEGPKYRNKSNKWPNEGSQFAKALKEPKTLFRMNEKEAYSALMDCILIKKQDLLSHLHPTSRRQTHFCHYRCVELRLCQPTILYNF